MRLNLPRRPLNVSAVITPTDDQISTCQEAIKLEEDKRKNWRLENIRRKHNYIPFIMNMLKILAEKGQLVYVFLEPSFPQPSFGSCLLAYAAELAVTWWSGPSRGRPKRRSGGRTSSKRPNSV